MKLEAKLIDHLDKLIEECRTQVDLFKLNGWETSELTSLSMGIAYQNVKDFITQEIASEAIQEAQNAFICCQK